MLEIPMRLPSVLLLSWKNDPVDWESRSEEEEREGVRRVVKEAEPVVEKSAM